MKARNKLGALLAAGSLIMAIGAATTSAVAPTYIVDLEKSANPPNVPSAWTVLYTITVQSTGTGDFATVNVDDGMAGCTLAGPTGDDGDGHLENGETWTYTCTVNNVLPNTPNTATVNACHNASGSCNQAAHDATDSDMFTVGEGAAPSVAPSQQPSQAPSQAPSLTPSLTPSEVPPSVTPSEAPPTEVPPTEVPPSVTPTEAPPTEAPPTEAPPTENPTGGEEGVDVTAPSTDISIGGGSARPGDSTWMLVVALGLLLASIVVVSPSKRAAEPKR